MAYQHIKLSKKGHIATVTLNRPEVMNALNREIMEEIEAVANSFLDDEDTRVVIFAGEGKHFSSGADLNSRFAEAEQSLLVKRRQTGLGGRMIRAILGIEQVTIAAVQGAALGGGACIPTACDFRIGSEDCFFGYPEVTLGINLMWTALPLCVHLIGPARAKKMVMSGEREFAERLLSWGYLDEVVTRDELMNAAQKMADVYVAQPPIAVQMIKRSINAITSMLDQAVMHMDADQNMLAATSEDRAEAVRAWFDKREPEFKGN